MKNLKITDQNLNWKIKKITIINEKWEEINNYVVVKESEQKIKKLLKKIDYIYKNFENLNYL
jgi:hypothetical protein